VSGGKRGLGEQSADGLSGYFAWLRFFCRGSRRPCTPRPPKRDFALGVSALYGVCLGRLKWRNSAASSAFWGERGTGIAPRLPHPGEVSPGAPSVPVGTFVVSPFASLGLNQGLQSANVLNGCGSEWGEQPANG